jgi:hypothetical protein
MKKHLITLITLAITYASTAQVPSYVPTNGLVGWWPFNGNANDESGNGNNGTVNGATLTSDRFGAANEAYGFDGNFISIPLTQTMVMMPARSISLWFKSSTGQTGGRLFEATNISWGIGCYNSNLFDCWYQKSNQAYNFVGESFQNHNEWYNLVFICDSLNQNKQIFLNGTLVNSGVPVTNFGNPTDYLNHFLKIGLGNANEAFFGQIDDIGFWNRALTQCEIQDLYNAELNSLSVNGGPDQEVCEGQSTSLFGTGASTYTWSNNVVNGVGFAPTATTSYILTGTDANGCIGTDTVNVVVNSASSSSQTQTALDSYTWPVNGQTYTQSGTYSDTLVNVAGCDSIVILNLTMSYTGIEELNPSSSKKLLRITDLSGKETPFRKNMVLLFIYEDGTVERVFEGE